MRLTDPKTMRELLADGWTRDQVYGAVKRGELVNLNRLDAWGRIRRGAGPVRAASRAGRHLRAAARRLGAVMLIAALFAALLALLLNL